MNELKARNIELHYLAQLKYQRKQNELLSPIIEKAKNAIDKISAAGGYLVIFDTSTGSLAYFDEAALTDIAPEVKKEDGITDTPAATPAAHWAAEAGIPEGGGRRGRGQKGAVRKPATRAPQRRHGKPTTESPPRGNHGELPRKAHHEGTTGSCHEELPREPRHRELPRKPHHGKTA